MTAIELMIVTAILGILAALIISGSAFRSRRAEARILNCRNQLKELSQAFFLYSGDHLSILPVRHDGDGIRHLRSTGYLPQDAMPEAGRSYLYYGGLLQVEFQADMGMLRDRTGSHLRGGSTAFGDGHVAFFENFPGTKDWFRTGDCFQMNHLSPQSAIRRLNRKLLWSSTWIR